MTRESRSGKHESRSGEKENFISRRFATRVIAASRLSHLKQRKIKKNLWDQGRCWEIRKNMLSRVKIPCVPTLRTNLLTGSWWFVMVHRCVSSRNGGTLRAWVLTSNKHNSTCTALPSGVTTSCRPELKVLIFVHKNIFRYLCFVYIELNQNRRTNNVNRKTSAKS